MICHIYASNLKPSAGLHRLAVFLLLIGYAVSPATAAESNRDTVTITFVGTGGPEISTNREGVATLVTSGNEHLMIDCGRNVMQNLYEAGVHPNDVERILLTHLHNDHIEGLPNLWMTSWFLLGRDRPLEIWGPPGTVEMVNGMYAMFQFDMEHRANRFNDPDHLQIVVHEIPVSGSDFEIDPFQIQAIPVEHDDGDPAFGYRLIVADKKMLFTGDTRLTEALIAAAEGTDVVVSNILAMSEELAAKPEMAEVVAKLMTIPEAVELFKRSNPRMGVYTHFVHKDIEGNIDVFIEKETRRLGWTGPLLLASDGWTLDLATMDASPPPDPKTLDPLDRKSSYRGN